MYVVEYPANKDLFLKVEQADDTAGAFKSLDERVSWRDPHPHPFFLFECEVAPLYLFCFFVCGGFSFKSVLYNLLAYLASRNLPATGIFIMRFISGIFLFSAALIGATQAATLEELATKLPACGVSELGHHT